MLSIIESIVSGDEYVLVVVIVVDIALAVFAVNSGILLSIAFDFFLGFDGVRDIEGLFLGSSFGLELSFILSLVLSNISVAN